MARKQKIIKSKERGKTVEISTEYKNWLKSQAALHDMTMQEFAEYMIQEFRKTHKDK
jgi:lipoate-protein ligase A